MRPLHPPACVLSTTLSKQCAVLLTPSYYSFMINHFKWAGSVCVVFDFFSRPPITLPSMRAFVVQASTVLYDYEYD